MVADAQHVSVARALLGFLAAEPNLVPACLDALASLYVDDADVHLETIEAAANLILSADAESAPVILKFLLSTSTSGNAENTKRVVDYVREGLEGVIPVRATNEDGQIPAAALDPKGKGKIVVTSDEDDALAIVADTLRSSFRANATACEMFLKQFVALRAPESHTPGDLWCLLALVSNGGPFSKRACGMLLKKCRTSPPAYTMEEFTAAIRGHGTALGAHFQSLLCIAEALASGTGPPGSSAGAGADPAAALNTASELYLLIFREFRSASQQTEVLACLLQHVGGRANSAMAENAEGMCALRTLQRMVTCPTARLQVVSYASMLESLLDFMPTMPPCMSRATYHALSALALVSSTPGVPGGAGDDDDDDSIASKLENELRMVVRKQLSHVEPSIQHLGRIGSVALLCALASTRAVDDSFPRAQSAARLLQWSRREVYRQGACAYGLWLDELADEVIARTGKRATREAPALAPDVVEKVLTTCQQDLEDLFLEDLDSTTGLLVGPGAATAEDEPRMVLTQLTQGGAAAAAAAHAAAASGISRLPRVSSSRSTAPAGRSGSAWLNLDGSRSPIALRIWPSVLAVTPNGQPAAQAGSLAFLAPLLRLLASCHASANTSLEEIDALLGCPLHLPTTADVHASLGVGAPLGLGVEWAPLARALCVALQAAIGWERELIGAFLGQFPKLAKRAPACVTAAGNEVLDLSEYNVHSVRFKVLHRLRSVYQLELLLDEVHHKLVQATREADETGDVPPSSMLVAMARHARTTGTKPSASGIGSTKLGAKRGRPTSATRRGKKAAANAPPPTPGITTPGPSAASTDSAARRRRRRPVISDDEETEDEDAHESDDGGSDGDDGGNAFGTASASEPVRPVSEVQPWCIREWPDSVFEVLKLLPPSSTGIKMAENLEFCSCNSTLALIPSLRPVLLALLRRIDPMTKRRNPFSKPTDAGSMADFGMGPAEASAHALALAARYLPSLRRVMDLCVKGLVEEQSCESMHSEPGRGGGSDCDGGVSHASLLSTHSHRPITGDPRELVTSACLSPHCVVHTCDVQRASRSSLLLALKCLCICAARCRRDAASGTPLSSSTLIAAFSKAFAGDEANSESSPWEASFSYLSKLANLSAVSDDLDVRMLACTALADILALSGSSEKLSSSLSSAASGVLTCGALKASPNLNQSCGSLFWNYAQPSGVSGGGSVWAKGRQKEVALLLDAYFVSGSSEEVCTTKLEHVVTKLLPSFDGTKVSADMPSLQAGTLLVWVKGAFKHLLSAYGSSVAKASDVVSAAQLDMASDDAVASPDAMAALQQYTHYATLLHDLVTVVRDLARQGVRGKTALVSECMSSCLKYVQLTGKLCDSLQKHASLSDAQCSGVFRCASKVQKSTRLLQIFCAEGKRWQDRQLLKMIPRLRAALESLLYRFKMVFAHRPEYANSWQIGKLKHKDLDGHQVSSQLVAPAGALDDYDDDVEDGDDIMEVVEE
ncbi:fanconi anemia group D2 protein [Pycnococcus provasolii]